MHPYIVPPMDGTLGALSGILTRAEARATDCNIKSEALLTFRLFPELSPSPVRSSWPATLRPVRRRASGMVRPSSRHL